MDSTQQQREGLFSRVSRLSATVGSMEAGPEHSSPADNNNESSPGASEREELDRLRSQLPKQREKLTTARKRISSLEKDLQQAKDSSANLKMELDAARRSLEENKDELENVRNQLREKVEECDRASSNAEKEVRRLRLEVEAKEKELNRIKSQHETLKEATKDITELAEGFKDLAAKDAEQLEAEKERNRALKKKNRVFHRKLEINKEQLQKAAGNLENSSAQMTSLVEQTISLKQETEEARKVISMKEEELQEKEVKIKDLSDLSRALEDVLDEKCGEIAALKDEKRKWETMKQRLMSKMQLAEQRRAAEIKRLMDDLNPGPSSATATGSSNIPGTSSGSTQMPRSAAGGGSAGSGQQLNVSGSSHSEESSLLDINSGFQVEEGNDGAANDESDDEDALSLNALHAFQAEQHGSVCMSGCRARGVSCACFSVCLCGKTFTDKASFYHHHYYFVKGKANLAKRSRYECPRCGKLLTTKATLDRHLNRKKPCIPRARKEDEQPVNKRQRMPSGENETSEDEQGNSNGGELPDDSSNNGNVTPAAWMPPPAENEAGEDEQGNADADSGGELPDTCNVTPTPIADEEDSADVKHRPSLASTSTQ